MLALPSAMNGTPPSAVTLVLNPVERALVKVWLSVLVSDFVAVNVTLLLAAINSHWNWRFFISSSGVGGSVHWHHC